MHVHVMQVNNGSIPKRRTGDPSFQKEELCLLRVLRILSLRVDSGTLFVSRESGLSSSKYSFKGVTFQGWK